MSTAVVAPETYSKGLARMHWLTAPAMLGCVGCVMVKQQLPNGHKDIGTLMFYHKSLGLMTAIFAGPRIAARLMSSIPSAMPSVVNASAEHVMAKATHVGLYGFLIAMPVTGIGMGYFGGKGLPFFFTTIPGKAEPDGATAGKFFKAHKTIGYYGKFLVPMHVGAAGAHAAKGHSIFSRISPFATKTA